MPDNIIPLSGPYQELAAEATYQIGNLIWSLMLSAESILEDDADLSEMKNLVDAICIRVKSLNGSLMSIVTGDGRVADAVSIRGDLVKSLGIVHDQSETAALAKSGDRAGAAQSTLSCVPLVERLRDIEQRIYSAHCDRGTLQGAFELLCNEDFTDQMSHVVGEKDEGIFSRFEAVKVAIGATLKELDTDLDAALTATAAARH